MILRTGTGTAVGDRAAASVLSPGSSHAVARTTAGSGAGEAEGNAIDSATKALDRMLAAPSAASPAASPAAAPTSAAAALPADDARARERRLEELRRNYEERRLAAKAAQEAVEASRLSAGALSSGGAGPTSFSNAPAPPAHALAAPTAPASSHYGEDADDAEEAAMRRIRDRRARAMAEERARFQARDATLASDPNRLSAIERASTGSGGAPAAAAAAGAARGAAPAPLAPPVDVSVPAAPSPRPLLQGAAAVDPGVRRAEEEMRRRLAGAPPPPDRRSPTGARGGAAPRASYGDAYSLPPSVAASLPDLSSRSDDDPVPSDARGGGGGARAAGEPARFAAPTAAALERKKEFQRTVTAKREPTPAAAAAEGRRLLRAGTSGAAASMAAARWPAATSSPAATGASGRPPRPEASPPPAGPGAGGAAGGGGAGGARPAPPGPAVPPPGAGGNPGPPPPERGPARLPTSTPRQRAAERAAEREREIEIERLKAAKAEAEEARRRSRPSEAGGRVGGGPVAKPPPTEPRPFPLSAPDHVHTRAAVVARVEEERAREMPFSPAINDDEMARAAAARGDFLARVAEDKVRREAALARRLAQRAEDAEAAFDEAHTGRPRLVARARLSKEDAASGVLDRAARVLEARRRRVAEALAQRAEAEGASARGVPDTSASRKGNERILGAKGEGYVPLEQRIEAEVDRRRQRLGALRQAQAAEHSFEPRLCARSVVLAEERDLKRDLWENELAAHGRAASVGASGPAGGRGTSGGLPSYLVGRPHSASAGGTCAVDPRDKDMTFKPEINARSRQMMDIHPERREDFAERVALDLEHRRRKEDHLAALHDEAARHPYKPELAPGTRKLLATSRRLTPRVGESYLDRVERLSYQDAERREAHRATQQEAHYSQFTFQPEILSKARRRAATPLDELVSDAVHRARLEELRKRAEDEEAEACPFQPDTSKPPVSGQDRLPYRRDAARVDKVSVALGDPDAVMERVHAQRDVMAERLALARERAALEELRGCSFRPEVHDAPPAPSGPVAVPGLGAFLRNKERAKRLEEEHRARCARVFNERPQARRGTTEPEAPELASQRRAEAKQVAEGWAGRRQNAAAEQAREREEETFKPRTNPRRRLVERILAEQSRAASEVGGNDENAAAV